MPARRPTEDQGEADVSDSGSDERFVLEVEGSDEEDSDSDAEKIISALRVPPADAEIPELRKALALCQKTLTETRTKLSIVTKDLRTLNATLPLGKKRKNVMSKTDPLSEDVARIAKKFAMLHRLWVIDGLFPITGKDNPDVDLWSANRWDSPAAKCDAVLTELFMVAPRPLQRQMAKYKPFGSVFTSTLNQERSNMLRVVKEASALVFAPLQIPDPTIFTSPTRKRDDAEMKRLSMHKEEYHRLAPVLFADPNQMTPDGFLRNAVLVNVLRLLIFGKNALAKEKARGGPKARGQIHGVRSVTQGLIALAATFVRYLLSPDSELQAVGSESKIPYEADYDFYLERLFKRSNWAINTVNWFNTEIFGSKPQENVAAEPEALPAPAHLWERDFLNNLDDPMEAAGPILIAPSASAANDPVPEELGSSLSSAYRISSRSNSVHQSQLQPSDQLLPRSLSSVPIRHLPPSPPARLSALSSLSHPDPPQVVTSGSMVSIHNHPGATLASVSQLQLEVGQMTISGASDLVRKEPTNAQTVSANRRVSSARRAPVPVIPESSLPPIVSEVPLVQKRVTRTRAKTKK